MKKIGIFGGSFSPTHNGHLQIAEDCLLEMGLDKIVFLPNANPPHKTVDKFSFDTRVEMLRLALEDNENFEISLVENDPTKVHYSYNTISENFYNGKDKFYFIMGDDEFLNIRSWYEYEKLLELTSVIVFLRKYDYNSILEKNREIIEKCKEQDIKVILASGRPDFGMMKIVDDLKLDSYDNYLLSFNGARIANLKTGEVVYEKFLSPERIKFLIDVALENNCDILTYQNGNVITNRDNEYARIETGLVDAKLVISENMKDDIKEGAAKVIILKHPDEAAKIKDKLAKELGDEYEVAMSKPFFIEVNDKGISKGASLDSLCKKLGLTNENVMALGDGLNDLSMIEFAGLGVAVENGNSILKEAADFISKSNDEDGFAYAIEKFVLNK